MIHIIGNERILVYTDDSEIYVYNEYSMEFVSRIENSHGIQLTCASGS